MKGSKKNSTTSGIALILCMVFLLFPCIAHGNFTPPENVSIERTWSMIAYGESIGVIRSVRQVEKEKNNVLIKDVMTGIVGTAPGVQMNSTETVWIGPKGMERFTGVFKETDKEDVVFLDGSLDKATDIFRLKVRMTEESPPYPIDFVKDKDYHWSVAYINFGRLGFETGKSYDRKILDFYEADSKDVHATYHGAETVEQAGKKFECHRVQFAYGLFKGTFWIAEDELGYFLVKEDAINDGVPFQVLLNEYRIKTVAGPQKNNTAPKKAADNFGF